MAAATELPIEHVDVAPLPPERFDSVLDAEALQSLLDLARGASEALAGRIVWQINSTARGGGVAEMLASLLAYTRGAGVDSRWVAIGAPPEFFRLTKRIHNRLHGAAGDGGPLGEEERALFDAVSAAHARTLCDLVRPGDVVIVHDPQPAGLIEPLREVGARVIWRLHVGADEVNDIVRETHEFVLPYIRAADRWVFSREAFIWEGVDRARAAVIPPSIDVFSPKNQDLAPDVVKAILVAAAVVDGESPCPPEFTREDGGVTNVIRHADMVEERRMPLDRRYVLQVSRWDRLKDHVGVLQGFAEHVAPHVPDVDLVLAGPAVEAVADDPEGADALAEVEQAFRALEPGVRERVHLARLPMDDRQENAAIVNALQAHAAVVVQKSLAEGFGLTVAEAMWKSRPMVASAVGGIQEQVVEDRTGYLVPAHDLAAFGAATRKPLEDPELARRLGEAGRQRVLDHFIGVRHLRQWVELIAPLVADGA